MKSIVKRKRKQDSGQLVSGTNYEKYAILNQDTHLTDTFIEHKKATAQFSFALVYNNRTFGIWVDYKEGKMYVSNDYYKSTYNIFALTTNDHSENTLLMKSINKYNCFKKFVDNYEMANVRYESQEIKAIFTEIINKILLHK